MRRPRDRLEFSMKKHIQIILSECDGINSEHETAVWPFCAHIRQVELYS